MVEIDRYGFRIVDRYFCSSQEVLSMNMESIIERGNGWFINLKESAMADGQTCLLTHTLTWSVTECLSRTFYESLAPSHQFTYVAHAQL